MDLVKKVLFGLKTRNALIPVDHNKDEYPSENDVGNRVLVFSPIYPEGHEMRWRIINTDFLSMCKEVTHYAILK